MYMRFHDVFQSALHSRKEVGREKQMLIRMRMVNVSEAAATEKGNVHPGRLSPAAPGQVMAVFDAAEDGAPPDPRSCGT
ncbi:unnamed protein product [Toxocara canis]|uniref:Uncharacterized protein n=1 Tax=Toxocara canis TaxID=6265 RepID=A0A183VGV5_TOXCA|nr:unnamed protein product [Toxocara canis]